MKKCKKISERVAEKLLWRKKDGRWIETDNSDSGYSIEEWKPQYSLDQCHVFERRLLIKGDKHAILYIKCLANVMRIHEDNTIYLVAANPLSRCEAFLEYCGEIKHFDYEI